MVGQVERLEAQLEGPPADGCHQPRDGQIDVPHAGTRDAVADVIAKLAGGWFSEGGTVQVRVERLHSVDVVADLIDALVHLAVQCGVAARDDRKPRPRARAQDARHAPVGREYPQRAASKLRRLVTQRQVADVRLALPAVASIEFHVVQLRGPRRELVLVFDHRVAEAIGPRVVAADADADRGAARGRQAEAAVRRRSEVVKDLEVADLLAHARVLERYHTPRVRIGGGAAHRIRNAIDHARTKSHEYRGAERYEVPQSVGVVTQIANRDAPFGANLPFHRHVPRLHARR